MAAQKPLKDKQLNISFTADTWKTLSLIEKKHKHTRVVFVRSVAEEACRFYENEGWISFPLKVIPEAFQWGAVAEEQQRIMSPSQAEPPLSETAADLAARLARTIRQHPIARDQVAGPQFVSQLLQKLQQELSTLDYPTSKKATGSKKSKRKRAKSSSPLSDSEPKSSTGEATGNT